MPYVAFLFALLALVLRLLCIDRQPLWFDEAMTLHIVHAPNGLDHVHNTPPLYYLLLRAWCGWFGVGTTALRSLSAVAGAFFVWFAFHAAHHLFGKRAAIAAACFATLAPIHVYYSQEARAYSLLLLVTTIALWTTWRLAQQWRGSTWLVLIGADVAALLTHYLAAIPLAIAHLGAALSAPREVRRRAVAAVGSAGLVAVLLLVPWLLFWSARTAYEPRDMDWLRLLWVQMGAFEPFLDSLELLLLGGQEGHAPVFLKQFTAMSFPDALRIGAFVAVGAATAIAIAQIHRSSSTWRVATAQCTALAVGPLVVLWGLSFVRPVYCPGRYDVVALPGFVLLVAAVVAAAERAGTAAKATVAVAIAVFLCAIGVKDWRYYAAEPAADPHRPIAERLAVAAKPDETVVLAGAVGVPVLAHLYQRDFVWMDRRCRSSGGDVEFGLRLLPRSLEDAPATVARYLRAVEDGSLALDLRQLLDETGSAGVWLALGDELRTGGRDAAMDALARRLFETLRGAGYAIVGGEPALGLVHLRR